MSGFMDGFAEGFSNSYAQSYDAAERRKLFMEENEKKKRESLKSVVPKIAESRQRLGEVSTKMEYFESRGLDEKTLNVLYTDPDALDSAYELLSTTGADWEPEMVNTYIRSAANTKTDGVSWQDHLETSMDFFTSMDIESMTPESVLTGLAGLTPERAGVAEFVPVPKEKNEGEAGISPTQDRTWKTQQTVFNSRMTQVAQSYLNTLLDDPNADQQEIAQIQQHLAQYGKSENSTMYMYDKFGELVLDRLKTTIKSPDALAGLEENPYLFIDTPDGKGFNPEAAIVNGPQGPDGSVLVATGIDPNDGIMTYFYRLPDGSTVQIKE